MIKALKMSMELLDSKIQQIKSKIDKFEVQITQSKEKIKELDSDLNEQKNDIVNNLNMYNVYTGYKKVILNKKIAIANNISTIEESIRKERVELRNLFIKLKRIQIVLDKKLHEIEYRDAIETNKILDEISLHYYRRYNNGSNE